jgi:hypothetical protein
MCDGEIIADTVTLNNAGGGSVAALQEYVVGYA